MDVGSVDDSRCVLLVRELMVCDAALCDVGADESNDDARTLMGVLYVGCGDLTVGECGGEWDKGSLFVLCDGALFVILIECEELIIPDG